MSSKHKSYVILILVALIWGAAAPIIKFTLQGVAPIPFLTYRFFLSFIVGVFALLFLKPHLPKNPKLWLALIIHSMFATTIALGFLFLGLERTTVLNLSLITLVTPLLIEIAGVVFLKETVTRQEKIGSAIAVFGALLTVIEPIMASDNHFGEIAGNFLILIYMISDIASIVLLKKIIKYEVSPAAISHFSFIVGFVSILPLALASYGATNIIHSVRLLSLPHHLGVWYMALVSGTLAYALRAKAQKYLEIGEAALFAYLVSVFSAPIAVFWLKEKITLPFIFGAIVIAVGIFIAEKNSGSKN